MKVNSYSELEIDEFIRYGCPMFSEYDINLLENLILLRLLNGLSLKGLFFNNHKDPALVEWVRLFDQSRGRLLFSGDCLPAIL